MKAPTCVRVFGIGVAAAMLVGSSLSASAADAAKGTGYLADVQTGNPQLQSIGQLGFGPHGILLVADPKGAAVVAIETGDLGPVKKLSKKIENVVAKIAAALGSKPEATKILDLAVNPESGRIYLSVQAGSEFALLTVDAAGEIGAFDLERARHVRIVLPGKDAAKVGAISGVAFAKDRVLATGQSREEFSSKIFSLPLPLKHGATADVFSAETYHVSHRKWETKAPIQSFIPFEENGKSYVVGAFACTPIAKFPLDDVQSGANVKGISMVELGSGNRPRDMFTYEKDGKRWIVTNTERFHKNLFGPSNRWGVRLDASYLTAETVNEQAARRDVSKPAGPAGMEIVESLFGAVEVDKLTNDDMIVLRDAGGRLDLEVAPLP